MDYFGGGANGILASPSQIIGGPAPPPPPPTPLPRPMKSKRSSFHSDGQPFAFVSRIIQQ